MKKIFLLTLIVCSASVVFALDKKPKKPEVPYRIINQRIHAEIVTTLDAARNDLKRQCEILANHAPKNNESDDYHFSIDITGDDENTLTALCEISGPSVNNNGDMPY